MTTAFRPPHLWASTVVMVLLSPFLLLAIAGVFLVLASYDLGLCVSAMFRRGERDPG